MRHVLKKLKTGAILIAVIAFLGLGIGSMEVIPRSAPVYIDDEAQSYMGLPCLPPSQIDNLGPLRLGTVEEARSLGFKPDSNCVNRGHHAKEGRSLTGKALESISLLSKIEHWWDHCTVVKLGKGEAELRCRRWPLQ